MNEREREELTLGNDCDNLIICVKSDVIKISIDLPKFHGFTIQMFSSPL